MDASQLKPLWTIDGVDFISNADVLLLLGEDETKIVQWCEDNNVVFGTWNSMTELSPCYWAYLPLAKAQGWTKVLLVGYADSSGAEWKPKGTTPL